MKRSSAEGAGGGKKQKEEPAAAAAEGKDGGSSAGAAAEVVRLKLSWVVQSEGQEDIPWGEKEETEVSVWAEDFAASGRVRMVATNATGENDERNVTATLVRTTTKKGDKEEELATVKLLWWADRELAHLMNFNMLMQELADFSSTLWGAAGRSRRAYSDMAIEFGESPHSRQDVNELIEEATGAPDEAEETLYVQNVRVHKGGDPPTDVPLLFDAVRACFNAHTIGHSADLPAGLRWTDINTGWVSLPGACWHVCPVRGGGYSCVGGGGGGGGGGSSDEDDDDDDY